MAGTTIDNKLVEDAVRRVLEENGLYIGQYSEDEPLDYDSITFISIIVSLEEALAISFDDSLLGEGPQNYRAFIDLAKRALVLNETAAGM